MSREIRLPNLYHQKKSDFLVIAHRGASSYFPENTMPAFEAAVTMQADMIELDVMLSSDGIPVVFHDAQLDHHSNGQGLLSYHTLKELQKLDAGLWFGKDFVGTKIPTLEQVLHFASGTIALNIEIKTEAVSTELQGGVEEKCLDLVRKYNMEDHVLFSSFNYLAIEHLKKLDPDMPAALLYNWSRSNGASPVQLVEQYRADAFNCSYRQFSNEWSQNLRDNNIPHYIYTVDHPNKMQQLLEFGVSGIFTNKPDILNSIIDQQDA